MSLWLPLAFVALTAAQTDTSTAAEDELPFTDAQLDYLEKLRDQIREELAGGGVGGAPAAATTPSVLELKAEAYVKWLFRNNASQGCVTYGNPHPRGDNYTGDNGACPEFALTLIARPMSKVEAGFRVQSRFGQQFADWFENGDERDPADASGESLGANHAALIQLRGIYVRIVDPLPLIDWALIGSSDLGYFDPWTVGRVRFIDRFNAKGIFLKTSLGEAMDLLIARVALSKLFGTANYNGLEEALVTNPFWARDAVYAASLSTKPKLIDGVKLTLNANLSIDEEADVRDPDAPGSVNVVDSRDEVTAVDTRFTGANLSLALDVTRLDWMRIRGLFALSHNNPNLNYVTNLALGGLGFSNVVYDDVTDFAGTVRLEFPDLLGQNRGLKFEYFNIGADYNAVAGSRREDDVLLTDGFLDGGQLPTLNLANELIDFNDKFYETVIGWHGATLLLEQEADLLDFGLEATRIQYNTDLQDRNMDIYPGFGASTGYTDTDLYSYANTNDRGRDPRTVYARDQARNTWIFMGRAALKPSLWTGARFDLKLKMILDNDLRDETTAEDDYSGTILIADVSVGAQPLDELSGTLGMRFDSWSEDGRRGTYAGGTPQFVDYSTTKIKPYLSFRYSLGGSISAGYHIEVVKKTIEASDPMFDSKTGLVWRSVGYLSGQF